MANLIVKKNNQIAERTYELTLKGANYHEPGQFINILIPDGKHFLRRPFSVADQCDDEIKIIYKVFGSGTKVLSSLKPNCEVDCLQELGHGFTHVTTQKVTLIGGGIGIPPLYYLAKELYAKGYSIDIVLGFNTINEMFYIKQFEEYGNVYVTTGDGSYGIKGTVMDCLETLDIHYYYAVGPTAMLKAIVKKYKNGQVSLEEYMGCGFGACMGCPIETKNGSQRVCKEGPVFPSEVLLWND
jgi:dihydroorotate dehydrogenase electron transfer subunit